MKKVFLCLCLILMVFSLVACSTIGQTSNAKITIGKSTKFNEDEINDAISCVKNKFVDFNGCKITKLWYDESESNSDVEDYFKYGRGTSGNVKPENVITLKCNFDVGFSGGNGILEPNSTYTNWMWVLVRDDKKGNWRVDDCGY